LAGFVRKNSLEILCQKANVGIKVARIQQLTPILHQMMKKKVALRAKRMARKLAKKKIPTSKVPKKGVVVFHYNSAVQTFGTKSQKLCCISQLHQTAC
jgi:hypothetical protein